MRVSNDPLPVAERGPRVAALESELSELQHVEEALVTAAIAAGEPVARSSSAPPAAVLGCADCEGFARRCLTRTAAPRWRLP